MIAQPLESTLAFNAGSDARIAGRSMLDNPNLAVTAAGPEKTRWVYWRMGYSDVAKNWGVRAKWPVRRLPLVRELAESVNGDGGD